MGRDAPLTHPAGGGRAAGETAGITIAFDPSDPVAGSAPGAWAVEELRGVLARRGVTARVVPPDSPPAAAFHLRLAALDGPAGRLAGLEQLSVQGRSRLRRGGCASAGRSQGGLRPAGRERAGGQGPGRPGRPGGPGRLAVGPLGTPANRVRGVLRTFASDAGTSPFYDREAWRGSSPCSRGSAQPLPRPWEIGYDFAGAARLPTYPYPFLLPVPGYDVRAGGRLPTRERERNLDALRFVAVETPAGGCTSGWALMGQRLRVPGEPGGQPPHQRPHPETQPLTAGTPYAPCCRPSRRSTG